MPRPSREDWTATERTDDTITRHEEELRLSLFEAFMGLHKAMEELDNQIEKVGLPGSAGLDRIESRAHKFYDLLEQWRGVVILREETGL